MVLQPQQVPKPPGTTAKQAITPTGDGLPKNRRRISAGTDTRLCPNERIPIAADEDMHTVAPSEQIVEDFHSLPTPTGKVLPFAVPFTPWLTIREGERYSHVGDGVLRAAIKRGEVPAYKRAGGKGVLVNMNDLDEWIRSWGAAKGAFA